MDGSPLLAAALAVAMMTMTVSLFAAQGGNSTPGPRADCPAGQECPGPSKGPGPR